MKGKRNKRINLQFCKTKGNSETEGYGNLPPTTKKAQSIRDTALQHSSTASVLELGWLSITVSLNLPKK